MVNVAAAETCGGRHAHFLRETGPCLDEKSKFQKKIPAPAWRLKSRRNKKHIATVVCKWRDESNEPN